MVVIPDSCTMTLKLRGKSYIYKLNSELTLVRLSSKGGSVTSRTLTLPIAQESLFFWGGGGYEKSSNSISDLNIGFSSRYNETVSPHKTKPSSLLPRMYTEILSN